MPVRTASSLACLSPEPSPAQFHTCRGLSSQTKVPDHTLGSLGCSGELSVCGEGGRQPSVASVQGTVIELGQWCFSVLLT